MIFHEILLPGHDTLLFVKIVSVNIERNKHFDTVIPFLERESADVVCLQEVMESSVKRFVDTLGMHATFVPFAILSGWEEEVEGLSFGVALLSKKKHTVRGIHYFQGNGEVRVVKHESPIREYHKCITRAVLVSDCQDDMGSVFTVGTTHFTYTPDGEPDMEQTVALGKLIGELSLYPDLVLTGDFNIPRANGLYGMLCKEFTDNVPQYIESSLDPELHRVKGLLRMVDYFWTKGSYRARDVRFEAGISDHCALVGKVDTKRE